MQEQELRDAVETGDINKLRTLCEQGAIEAVEADWPDARSYFMVSAIKPAIDMTSGTPKVAPTGHTAIVAYLLQLGANVNYAPENNFNDPDRGPLHWASAYGYKDIAALLIQHGADVNAKWEATGSTPLATAIDKHIEDDPAPDEATKQRLFDTIRFLVDKGADVNARNNTKEYPDDIGETVLFRAYRPELIKYLVDKGADVNAKNNMGRTPLHHIASFASGTRTAVALIECGADVNAVDNYGKTPLDLALGNDRARSDEMKELLQSYQTPKPTFTSPPPPPAKSGGCMGVLAVIACVIVGLGVLFSVSQRGTSQPSYAPVHYTSPALPVSQPSAAATVVSDGDSDTAGASDPSPQWQGEHFPQTRQGYLQQSDIQGWAYSGVRYALNEMYARHGYPFKAAPLRRQFQKFSWYHPNEGRTAASVEAQFTPAEHSNQVLLAQQRSRLVQEGKATK